MTGKQTPEIGRQSQEREEMERQKHFVLVHGAGHGAWCWYKVATLLKSAGHKVTALDMAASGLHPKRVEEVRDISDYFEPLMEFMKSLPPEERVILVGHSMGGLCNSVAMERFPEKISCAVFATAIMPGPDLSFTATREEYARQMNSYIDSQYTFVNGPDNPPTSLLFGPDYMSMQLYQLSPTEDLTLAMLLLRPHPLFNPEATQEKVWVTKERFGSVPRVYIICDQDNIMKEALQRWIIENNPPDEVKVVSGSDHMLMFSKPQEMCSCLQEVAKSYF
ncbi:METHYLESTERASE FAMILY MEMBER [Salix viminalis]|uniref:(S)-hydroxynitrile lyase n=1 Tax=Salix viminalis TaxID=40686 RepID=A0A9Q0NYW5_SALVM|nr:METHYLESTERASE FAMILY MEMBER [Salix viminalis]